MKREPESFEKNLNYSPKSRQNVTKKEQFSTAQTQKKNTLPELKFCAQNLGNSFSQAQTLKEDIQTEINQEEEPTPFKILQPFSPGFELFKEYLALFQRFEFTKKQFFDFFGGKPVITKAKVNIGYQFHPLFSVFAGCPTIDKFFSLFLGLSTEESVQVFMKHPKEESNLTYRILRQASTLDLETKFKEIAEYLKPKRVIQHELPCAEQPLSQKLTTLLTFLESNELTYLQALSCLRGLKISFYVNTPIFGLLPNHQKAKAFLEFLLKIEVLSSYQRISQRKSFSATCETTSEILFVNREPDEQDLFELEGNFSNFCRRPSSTLPSIFKKLKRE